MDYLGGGLSGEGVLSFASKEGTSKYHIFYKKSIIGDLIYTRQRPYAVSKL